MPNLQDLASGNPRFDLTRDEIREIYDMPLPQLIHLAQTVHQKHYAANEVQISTLLSIKTGGCKENCAYCPQSAHYATGVDAHGLLDTKTIVESAKAAKANGSSRFCMGAAWRSPPKKGPQFDRVIEAIKEVRGLGLEVCTTLGMVDEEQAEQLADAGVYAYNHNLDTSPEFYGDIISTRTYQDRLDTLENVRRAGMTVCCGGIVGMGESTDDRIGLLEQLNHLSPHPESVPVNLLVKVAGTPLAENDEIDIFEMVRTIATACIILPVSRVRLSAGREQMSDEAQALCFLAGASSIFSGDKLLTTPNPGQDKDQQLLEKLGMSPVKEAKESPRMLANSVTNRDTAHYEPSIQ
ncbi:MAG: biotin synthase BioB [Pseudobacteriovorax sp.]|nr:biotin synthase BioB [Pseudobacteriovorax sp.]